MKFRLLALGLLATTASVAAAHALLMPLPERTGALARSTEQSRPTRIALPTHASTLPAPSPPSLDATRPPVPVFLSQRRPFVPASEAASTSPSAAATAPPGTVSEAAAKAAIEADGYKGVGALARGSDGVWKATALRGQTEVQLSVGPTGRVSAN